MTNEEVLDRLRLFSKYELAGWVSRALSRKGYDGGKIYGSLLEAPIAEVRMWFLEEMTQPFPRAR